MSRWDDEPDDSDPVDKYWDDLDRDEENQRCLFPGKCCMPGPHGSDECHTVEMIQAYESHLRKGFQ